MILDYQNIDVTITDNKIVLSRDDETLMKFIPEAVIEDTGALLRIQGKIAMYRVVINTEDAFGDIGEMLRIVLKKLPDSMFYAYGQSTIRNRKNSHKVNCRTLVMGSTQLAQRNGRLTVFPVRIPGVGMVDIEGTGDTSALYDQLNSLL